MYQKLKSTTKAKKYQNIKKFNKNEKYIKHQTQNIGKNTKSSKKYQLFKKVP